MNDTLSSIGEFGLIEKIDELIRAEGLKTEGIVFGLGDDTAIFRPPQGFEILATCDSFVEGRHFLSSYLSYYDVGRRAMTANISDIGAMGGLPLYALVSLGLPESMTLSQILNMYRGFLDVLNPLGASIIGGNITKVDTSLFIDITLFGTIKPGTAVLRSTAQPGDVLLVTGFPGEAAAGLEMVRSGGEYISRDHPLIKAYTSPVHRAREGQAVAASGYATAMIDTSDGLLADLAHICQDSHVGADLKRKDLPISEDLKKFALRFKKDPFELCTRDSDDYELVIACPPDNVAKIRDVLAQVSDVPVSVIGSVTEEEGMFCWSFPDGTRQTFSPKGWDHFSK